MSGNSGLLTTRCDPYGAESAIKLLGGMYPENQVGRIMWHCSNRAVGRFYMECIGGRYGTRTTGSGLLEAGYVCDGGHRSSDSMPLCVAHRKSIARRQADLCPACAFPARARELQQALESRQADMHTAFQSGLLVAAAKLGAAMDDLMMQMNELSQLGIIHRCPLRLIEVS